MSSAGLRLVQIGFRRRGRDFSKAYLNHDTGASAAVPHVHATNISKNRNSLNSLTMPKKYPFTPTHTTLANVLTDHNLAQLGDAYTNFIYSLARSSQKRKPTGKKVENTLLAQALRKANLRQHLPSRATTHMLADAAEALLVYVWLHNYTTLQEAVATLQDNKNAVEALARLLTAARNRIKLS